MGRNRKLGLDYFPMDADFFQDIRIRKLIKYQGGKAVTVYALLLCIIYKQGYYVRWDEELPFIISAQTGFEEAYIQEVFKCCLVVGLFSKKLYDSDKVILRRNRHFLRGNRHFLRRNRLLKFICGFNAASTHFYDLNIIPISSNSTEEDNNPF